MSYPALELLLQGYLSLDWPDDYPSVWGAVDDYLAQEPASSELPIEIDQLLQAATSEEALRAVVLGELGSGYRPEADGFTMRAWLLAVRERTGGRRGE